MSTGIFGNVRRPKIINGRNFVSDYQRGKKHVTAQ